MLRLVLLKLTYDRKKQGLPNVEEDRQVGRNYSL